MVYLFLYRQMGGEGEERGGGRDIFRLGVFLYECSVEAADGKSAGSVLFPAGGVIVEGPKESDSLVVWCIRWELRVWGGVCNRRLLLV